MSAKLLDGWFADRAAGQGKPVYSSGTTIVPTNGLVGVGVSAGAAPTFGTPSTTNPALNLLDGWFADRATGRGKPVYSTGTTIVPTNGLVGVGVSAGAAPTFGLPAVSAPSVNLLTGWFCDRAPGDGKQVYASPGVKAIVPVNGLSAVGVPAPGPSTAGGKFYFEITVVNQSNDSAGSQGSPGQGTGVEIGFINDAQKNEVSSALQDQFFTGTTDYGAVPYGLAVKQGRTLVGANYTLSGANGAVINFNSGFQGYSFIAGTADATPLGSGGAVWNDGDVVGVCVDTINGLWWARNWTSASPTTAITAGWIGGGDPAAGTNGLGLPAGNLYIWWGAPGRYLDTAT